MPTVTFMPEDLTLEVTEGENLLRAAMLADVAVKASCGGDGTCETRRNHRIDQQGDFGSSRIARPGALTARKDWE